MKESMSNIEVRNINRANIVKVLLRENTLTKAGITQELGLSLATVNTFLKELMAEGLVERGEVLQSTGGRKPTLYQVVANAHIAIGVALTGHHIRLSYVNWKLDVIYCVKERILFENTDSYWKYLRERIEQFMGRNGIREDKLQGIGIAIESEIIENGTIEDIIPQGIFRDIDMEKVREMYSCPVYFFDDVKAAAFSHIGAHKERNRYVYLQLDQRVGGALICDGDFYGLSNRTGSFGNMLVGDGDAWDCEKQGKTCNCSGKGCLQYYCSSRALKRDKHAKLEEFFTEMEEGGNEEYRQRWNNYIGRLAIALHNLRVIFDADIMIGGEISPFIHARKEELMKLLHTGDIYREEVDYIHFSKGEEYDSAIGSGYLVVEKC